MFDIGFFELLLIGLVALLVVGPERLPKVARTAGLWIGKGRRFISSVKADIEQEIKADELKRILEEQKRANPMHKIMEDTRKTVEDLKSKTVSSPKPTAEKAAPPAATPSNSNDGSDKP
jgi:sec-independent protein translocase protein TatB